MSKSVKCPSCRMRGRANGETFALVATHRGRPVVQCFWCDSQVHLRRFKRPVLIEVEPQFQAVFTFERAVEYDSLMSLLELDEEFAARTDMQAFRQARQLEDAASPGQEAPPGSFVSTLDMLDEPQQASELTAVETPDDVDGDVSQAEPVAAGPASDEPIFDGYEELDEALAPAAYEAHPQDPEPYSVDPGVHNLLQLSNHVGWMHPVNRRYQPEFMNMKIPPMRPMTPRQASWHEFKMMMKYFTLNAGGQEQKRRDIAHQKVRMAQARQLRREQRRLRLDLRRFETGEAI